MKRVKRWAAGGLLISLACGGLADDAPRPVPSGPTSARAPQQPAGRNGSRNDRPRNPPPASAVAPTPATPAPPVSTPPVAPTAPPMPAQLTCELGLTRCSGQIIEWCVQAGSERTTWASMQVCNCTCQFQDGFSYCDDTPCSDPPRLCLFNQVRCDGDVLAICAPDGFSWLALEPCATECLCQASAQNGLSTCLPPSCPPGEAFCDGSERLQRCNACADGYDVIECGAGESCDPLQGRCVAPEPVSPADAGVASP